ncbi:MAG: hypothetical protein M1833_003800 [Piccolia ochrophora]|nr:MAG: hypothetical protein M1833_003800 [Piccolia ochrophora]
MGWVYCCTQDLSSISRVHPDTAHGHQEPGNHGNINLNVGRPAEYCNVPNYYQLSSREVNELYTPQQLRIIRAQKYNIAVTAATQAALAGDIAQRSPTTPSQEPLPPPGSVLPSLSALLSSISSSLTPTGPHRQPLHSNPLTCQWKCCPRCRPASRDRAWVSLAAVLHDDIGPFHGLESNDIPISPRDVVCNLGLRQPPPPPFWMDEPLSTPDESSDSDLALTRTSVQAHMNNPTGFRASVRRAFRQMLMSNRRNHQDTVSPYSYNTAAAPSTSSTSGLSTLTELGEDDGDYQDDGSLEQDQDVDEFDIAFYAQLNDAVLTEAAETALPEEREYEPVEDNDEDEESEDGDEGFGSEPVEVHGGVAVTEEAVQMREADVMTQV